MKSGASAVLRQKRNGRVYHHSAAPNLNPRIESELWLKQKLPTNAAATTLDAKEKLDGFLDADGFFEMSKSTWDAELREFGGQQKQTAVVPCPS